MQFVLLAILVFVVLLAIRGLQVIRQAEIMIMIRGNVSNDKARLPVADPPPRCYFASQSLTHVNSSRVASVDNNPKVSRGVTIWDRNLP